MEQLALFSGKQKIAYGGLVSLLLSRGRFESNWAGTQQRLLFAFLDVSADEQTMLNSLADPRAGLLPTDLVHELCGLDRDVHSDTASIETLETLASPACIKETIIAHLFILSVSGNSSIYDARSRALLFQVADALSLSDLTVIKVENDVRDSLGLNGATLGVGSGRDVVDRRNKMESVKHAAYITLATIAGGVLIGATAGLAGPAVAGVFTSAHAVHCGGTAAVGLGSTGVALFATGGAVTAGGMSGFKVMKKTRGISEFEFIAPPSDKPDSNDISAVPPPSCHDHNDHHMHRDIKDHSHEDRHSNLPPTAPHKDHHIHHDQEPKRPMNVLITIPGFIGSTNQTSTDALLPFVPLTTPQKYGDPFTLLYESTTLQHLGAAITLMTYYTHLKKQILAKSLSKKNLIEALVGPLWIHRLSYLIDKPWTPALEKSKNVGHLLADAIESRVQGGRPVTLVGFGIGAAVIYYALLELSKRGKSSGPGSGHTNGLSSDSKIQALVDQVYLVGCPVLVNPQEWKDICRVVVVGRVVNAYLAGDAMLQLVFRKHSGSVAGLGAVEGVDGVENVSLDGVVEGHVDYYCKMGDILSKLAFTGVDKGDEKENAEFARVRFETDLEDAQERFKDEWNRDVDLAVKQEAFDQSNGVIGGGSGLFSWLSRSSEPLKSKQK
ncbi:UNVERIFIED_CONTAM: hypothetical protein HDU68_008057 [Siphonaria sp. JEL0065]|nr:hypothetical protein HDU68_008057 [Siphonaria sp. JEL0065]